MTLKQAIRFFKGLQSTIDKAVINEISKNKNLDKEQLLYMGKYEFKNKIFEAYFNEISIEMDYYNELLNVLENCLKMEPHKFKGYIKKYPIIKSFMFTTKLCQLNVQEYKNFLIDK